MQKFLLMLSVVFGLVLAIYAQDTGTASKSPASASESSATAPAQPITFNHKLHIQTAKMTCNDCHEPRGDGSTLALPQPPRCMSCHASVATDNPDIKRLAEAAKNEDPILWVRIYRVPSFVTFSHRTHAGNNCEECHGPVAERTAIAQEKDTNMGSCIACHQAKGAPATCDTCHAIMSTNGRSPFDVDPTVLARLQIQPAGKPATMDVVELSPRGVAVNGRLVPNTTPLAMDTAGRRFASAREDGHEFGGPEVRRPGFKVENLLFPMNSKPGLTLELANPH